MSGPTAFVDLSADSFPFTVIARDAAGRVVWRLVVESPGMVQVPALAREFGPVEIEILDGAHPA